MHHNMKWQQSHPCSNYNLQQYKSSNLCHCSQTYLKTIQTKFLKSLFAWCESKLLNLEISLFFTQALNMPLLFKQPSLITISGFVYLCETTLHLSGLKKYCNWRSKPLWLFFTITVYTRFWYSLVWIFNIDFQKDLCSNTDVLYKIL